MRLNSRTKKYKFKHFEQRETIFSPLATQILKIIGFSFFNKNFNTCAEENGTRGLKTSFVSCFDTLSVSRQRALSLSVKPTSLQDSTRFSVSYLVEHAHCIETACPVSSVKQSSLQYSARLFMSCFLQHQHAPQDSTPCLCLNSLHEIRANLPCHASFSTKASARNLKLKENPWAQRTRCPTRLWSV